MLDRLRQIDDELRELPEKIAPLEQKVGRVREVVQKSEQNNPLRRTLAQLLKNAEGAHVENLGWLVGRQSMDPGEVALFVERFLLKQAGQSSGDSDDGYDAALRAFVKVDGAQMPPGMVEGALLRKLVGEPWLELEAKARAHVLDNIKNDVNQHGRWMPEAQHQVLDAEGRGLVGEGAGAFGSYFTASVLVGLGMRAWRLNMPARSFALLNGTLAAVTADPVFGRMSKTLLAAAPNPEKGRGIVTVAYVHFIRSMELGDYERDHEKLIDALSAAEVAVTGGRRRIDRLREARSEIVVQGAGVGGVVLMAIAAILYGVYFLLS
jgi:hypothetical protein